MSALTLPVTDYVKPMTELRTQLSRAPGAASPPAGTPAQRQAALALVLLVPVAGLAGGLVALQSQGIALLASGLLAASGGVLIAALGRLYPHRSLGLCNLVTLTRLAGVAVLAALLAAPETLRGDGAQAWAGLAIAGAVLALDGVDGWAARRARLQSRFGARFDMEVDAALALVLALLAWQTGKVGAWVLALGALRPAFALAALHWHWLARPLPEGLARKAVCVVQIGVLTALLAPAVTAPLAGWLAAGALVLLLASFGRDTLWLWRRMRR